MSSGDEDVDHRKARVARNESRFRELNERIEKVSSSLFTEYVCECTLEGCGGTVSLSLDEYEHVRKVPTHFVVALGHSVPYVERVVLENSRFQVVEKVGVAAEVAERLDPRSPRSNQ